jgi:hypothetical protein
MTRVVWQIRIMRRPGMPWALFGQGASLRAVMAFLSVVRVAMAATPARFTVVRTESRES